jgi:acetyl-CoA acetyltransferase
MRDATAIAGLGATPYYRRGGSAPQTRYELVGKAVLAAVADAGLSIEDVDGFTFSAGGLIDPAFLVEMLGAPELNFAAVVSGGGGGSAGAVGLASMAVATGQARAVVAVGMCQQAADHRYGSVFTHFEPSSEVPFFSAAGLVGPGQAMAMMARRRMHAFGERREHYAEVAISTRLYASTRETALKREPLTLDDYLAAPMVAEPLCLFDYCLETDGAVAVVVTSTERARDLAQPPVLIAGAVQGGSRDWGRGFFWQNMPEETYLTAGEHPVARRLYEMAGVTAADIDVALLYDHFAPLVLSQLEDYGFCPRGEAGPFVAGGAIRKVGTIPVNTHGGHLSEAYVIGFTHVREAVEQIRGVAVNQVEGATHALVSGGPAPIPLSGLILRR